jgi:hypothetical protein
MNLRFSPLSPEELFWRLLNKTAPRSYSVLKVYVAPNLKYSIWSSTEIAPDIIEQLHLKLVLERPFVKLHAVKLKEVTK